LLAFDTGPGNGPLDRWVHQHSPFEYDRDGEVSAAGKPIEAAVEALLSATYFRQRPPKSLDAGDLRITLPDTASLEDGAATLARCVAASVACAVGHLPAPPRQWLVCGGGAHNRTIMRFLQEALGVPVRPASDLGWDGDALEAQAFAFLAVRSLRGLPLTYPTTTGCPQPISGGVLHWPD